MYVQHFGLQTSPFRVAATGPDVFVGPQTAKAMAGLKKALEASDAIVTVSGDVGVGKTTLVHRALSMLGTSRVIISVGRIQLRHDEVLELLLDELGTRQVPSGTVQRFSLFRRLLKDFADKGTRVFIVVEDASRIGADALSELEALTAADAGVSDGANIILMGAPGINNLMKAPQLARLKQRIRLRESIRSLGSSELGAYLKHCFRLAGGDFDTLFADGTSDLLHRLSGGIPRVVNNTVETILGSAAEQSLNQITPQFITTVVAECGMTGQMHELDPASADMPGPIAKDDSSEQPEAIAKPEQAQETVAEPVAEAQPGHVSTDVPVEPNPELQSEFATDESAVDETETESPAAEEPEIPELIQDTLPNLSILAPELAAMPTPEEARAEPVSETAAEANASPAAAVAMTDEPDVSSISTDIPERIFDEDTTPLKTMSRRIQVEDDGIPTLSSSMRLDQPLTAMKPAEVPKAEIPELEVAEVEVPELEVPELEVPKFEVSAVETPDAEAPVAQAQPVAQESLAEPASPAAVTSDVDSEQTASAASTNAAEPVQTEVPAWELDPTLAELRPDLEALERAMSYSQTDDADTDTKPAVGEPTEEKAPDVVPLITLDRAIQEKIDEATELLKKTTIDLAEVTAAEEKKAADKMESARQAEESSTAKTPEVEEPARLDNENNAELEKISTELARAKTIEEVDEKMAETLFGEEFSQIAAQVAALVAADPSSHEISANDDLQLEADGTDAPATPVATSQNIPQTARKPVVLPSSMASDDNLSATQRLRTVRALNGNFDPVPEHTETIVLGGDNIISSPPTTGQQSKSIEDQINTSMTQTLKALDVRPPPTFNFDDDDDEDESKGGFFSRFRRS